MTEFQYTVEVLQVTDADASALPPSGASRLSLVFHFVHRGARCRVSVEDRRAAASIALVTARAPFVVRSPHRHDSVDVTLFAQLDGSSCAREVAVAGAARDDAGFTMGGAGKEVGVRWLSLVSEAIEQVCRVQVMWEVVQTTQQSRLSGAGAAPVSPMDASKVLSAARADVTDATNDKDSSDDAKHGELDMQQTSSAADDPAALEKLTPLRRAADVPVEAESRVSRDGFAASCPGKAAAGCVHAAAVDSDGERGETTEEAASPSSPPADETGYSPDATQLQSTSRFQEEEEKEEEEAPSSMGSPSAAPTREGGEELQQWRAPAVARKPDDNIIFIPKESAAAGDGEAGSDKRDSAAGESSPAGADAFDAIEECPRDDPGAAVRLNLFATSTQHGVPLGRAYANLYTLPAPVLLLRRDAATGRAVREGKDTGMLRGRIAGSGGTGAANSVLSALHWMSVSALRSLQEEANARNADGHPAASHPPTSAAALSHNSGFTGVGASEEVSRAAFQELKEDVLRRAERREVLCTWRK